MEHGGGDRDSRDRDRVVTAMLVAVAALTLLFDVGDLAARRHFAIATDDAAAAQSGKSQQPDDAHVPTLAVGSPTEALTLREPRGSLHFRTHLHV